MVKAKEDIILITKAAEIWKIVRQEIIKNAKINTSLLQLDELARHVMQMHGASPTFVGYYGYKYSTCISVNNQLIHAIPTNYCLKNHDMVTFDVGVTYQDHVADGAFTIFIGEPTPEATRINDVTYQSLMAAIKIIKPGIKTGLIGATIQKYIESNGFYVIKDFTGHGCGNKMHESPTIPNYGFKNKGTILRENEVICIEPMVLSNNDQYVIDPYDQWTVSSTDGSLTCHWEHMVLITKDGAKILTE